MQRLLKTIPPQRLSRYQNACAATSVDPLELYLWSGRVALAMFDDLVHVEVALRSAIAEQLYAAYGPRWYARRDVFDYPTLKLIGNAWRQGGLATLKATDDVIHGKLVATLMFGFWVKLLGKGTNLDGDRRIFDTLIWKAGVRDAFPNVGDLERTRVETAIRNVKELRNRIAHHEHIVWGVPLSGKRDAQGQPLRLSVSDAQGTMIALAGYVDSGLADWIKENSAVKARLDECPLEDRSSFML